MNAQPTAKMSAKTVMAKTAAGLRKIPGHYYLAGSLIFLPAFLAVFFLAHNGLNADIAINQVMSLHKLTLFYWGQNRLLNLLPFLAWPIRIPIANLFLILLAATLSFFSLIYLLAFLARKLAGRPGNHLQTGFIYLVNICLGLLFLKNRAWVDICLWHFEYSLPLLLMTLNIYACYCKSRPLILLSFLGAFIAFGLNPGILLIFLPIIFCKGLYTRKISLTDLAICALYVLFFLSWYYLSTRYDSYSNYSTLLPDKFHESIENFTVNLLREYLNIGNFLIFALANLVAAALFPRKAIAALTRIPLANTVLVYALASSLALTFFIVCIRWFHLNQYSPRYLIFIVYIAIFVNSLYLAGLIPLLKIGKFALAPAMCLLLAAVAFFFFPASFNLRNCAIYQELDAYAPPGNNFYVGDYWKIWTAVSRDLNDGFESYSLGYRSVSNRAALEKQINDYAKKNGCLQAHCLDAASAECERQMKELFPQWTLTSIRPLNARNILMLFASPKED